MKPNIDRMLAISLIASILTVTGSLCLKSYQDMRHAPGTAGTDDAISDSFSADPCYQWRPDKLLAEKLLASIQPARQGNSILPCCSDGSRSNSASVPRSEDANPLCLNASFAIGRLPLMVSKSASYHNPKISPPEMTSIRATVIRT